MKVSNWLLVFVGIISVYALFVMFSDISLLIEKFQNIELKYVVLGIVVVFIGLFLRAIRWFLMLKSLDVEINLKSCILIYFSGTAFGLTPGRLGEVIKSHYLKRLVNTPLTTSAPTIIVERILDVFAILFIAISIFFLIGIQNNIVFIGIGILALSFFLIYQRKLFLKLLNRTESTPIIGKLSKNLITAIDIIFTLTKPKSISLTLPLSILSWLLESFVVYFVLKSFDIQISVVSSIFIFVVSSLLGAISFLPGGVGATEGGLFGLLYLENISYNDAVGPVLVIRIIVLWMTIIFGLIINRLTEITILKNK